MIDQIKDRLLSVSFQPPFISFAISLSRLLMMRKAVEKLR